MIWEYVIVPILGWAGYLQNDKVSKGTCKATHEALCMKIDDMHKDVREIRDRLFDHIEEG